MVLCDIHVVCQPRYRTPEFRPQTTIGLWVFGFPCQNPKDVSQRDQFPTKISYPRPIASQGENSVLREKWEEGATEPGIRKPEK